MPDLRNKWFHGLAWTISDLSGHSSPDPDDVAEAVGWRTREAA